VVIPRDQVCCGALMVHSGMEEDAIALAKRTIAAFESASVDTIVINSAGCGSTMKEYGYLLRDDEEFAARAAAFSAKCKDIAEILCELEPRAPRQPLKLRVAYHDACHLQHAQGVRAQPRRLLEGIPGLTVAEIPESSLCCGSAGVYNLLEPDTASQLGDRKVENLLTTDAQAVLSANPGCLLQLMSGLRRRGLKAMPAFHMVEALDASIRGVGAEDFLRGDGNATVTFHIP
jgi:glycolate oxidase iron-sulfur subunit